MAKPLSNKIVPDNGHLCESARVRANGGRRRHARARGAASYESSRAKLPEVSPLARAAPKPKPIARGSDIYGDYVVMRDYTCHYVPATDDDWKAVTRRAGYRALPCNPRFPAHTLKKVGRALLAPSNELGKRGNQVKRATRRAPRGIVVLGGEISALGRERARLAARRARSLTRGERSR